MSLDFDLVCLSHLRWDFVFQRPQHLMTRCARDRRTFFFEEPIFDIEPGGSPRLDVTQPEAGLHLYRAVPHLPMRSKIPVQLHGDLLRQMMEEYHIDHYVLWYYTPMALPFSDDLHPLASIYDAMDQLAAFKGAPPELIANEKLLYKRVDMVFTGGQSLYEAKQGEHEHVYAFPSSIEPAHFKQARAHRLDDAFDPADQAEIAHPRVGFYGVIDERLDIDLLGQLADLRPDVQLVVIGPVVKIDPASLPQRANIHYLGGKSYKELPQYLSGWDVAMMPFAMNESTEFISPTKTPEYLAAGCPVVSTPIKDVVRPYQVSLGLAHIARTPEEFSAAIDAALAEDEDDRLRRVDEFLSQNSWDQTWERMSDLIQSAVDANARVQQPKAAAAVGASR